MGAVLSALALANSVACYSYLPLATEAAPRVGERVRLQLTPQGMTEMARFLGPLVAEAEGTLTSVAADGTLGVAVDVVQHVNGIREPWSGEGLVSFPHGYLTEVRERVYQRGKSIAAGVALGGALVALAAVALKGGGARGGSGGTNPPPP